MKAADQLLRRCRLLDAARGCWKGNGRKHPLPSFSLKPHHFGDLFSASPSDFHSQLCNLIRNAQERVYIASLYIGPGASLQYHQEVEFLDALKSLESSHDVSIKIVMDRNRALRKIQNESGIMTSSAQAVAQALQFQHSKQPSLHLFQALPSPFDYLLPNPLNEVAGVFHIKAYIVDDSLILSGANLSQEYFTNRQDRYLWICNGGNGLVDFYAQMIEILCENSSTYPTLVDSKSSPYQNTNNLLNQINRHFREENAQSSEELLSSSDTVAVGIPTFHAPKGFWPNEPEYWTDVEAILALLEEGIQETSRVQLSSAYLNPTMDLLRAISDYPEIDFVTAGRLSHGFAPKTHKTAGNQQRDWIPTVFDHLADQTMKEAAAKLYHWERKDWTFHSKGLWIKHGEDLAAAAVGSSNFGGRSFVRDMESNLLMVFPPSTDQAKLEAIAKPLQDEWKEIMKHSKMVNTKALVERAPPLPIHIQSLLPYIKTFF